MKFQEVPDGDGGIPGTPLIGDLMRGVEFQEFPDEDGRGGFQEPPDEDLMRGWSSKNSLMGMGGFQEPP